MRVLVLRHHEEDAPGLIGEAFEARGMSVVTRLFPAEGPLPSLVSYHQVVVLGSKWSVYDTETVGSWIDEELAWLQSADEAGVPVLGVCFGAQMLATAFGGYVDRAPEPEIGWMTIEQVDARESLGGDLVLSAGPWFQFHRDRCALPPSAVLRARSPAGPQVFTIGRNLGVQFHPEIEAGQLSRWMDNGAREAIEAVGKDPDVLLVETAREEEPARGRTQELVDEYLLWLANRG
ncbi:MAG: type 1 glutamine amidotransferase [Acidimicrobiales bacterium]